MRRSFSFALASLTLASASIGLTVPGCGTSALDVQDLCGWIADECNCYRKFAAGVANVQTGAVKCGVALDSGNNYIDPATGSPIADETLKPTFGTFTARDKLDVCIRPQGGQVVFGTQIVLEALPAAVFDFTILDASGNICATGSYAGITNFSIGFPAAAGAGGAGGAGGNGGNGGAGGEADDLCRAGSTEAYDGDPSKDPISGGTFSMSPGDEAQIVETLCPNGDPHRFNLYQLNKCDGNEANEDNYKALLPTAEIEADPGSVNVDGYIRFRVFWPPTEAVAGTDDLNTKKPFAVEYFHCLIPGASAPCFDGALSDGEADVDCGTICPLKCEDGKDCLVGSDCASQVCETNAMGFLKCVSPPCGDEQVTGAETCDDGNTNPGDGCSATCTVEPGYTCNGPGKCADIDECALGTDDCPPSNKCKNTIGAFTCECEAGFSWDGMDCVEGCGNGDKQPPEACDDANKVSGDGCDANCLKEEGYFCMGEGPGSCVDIPECSTGADDCLNTETCVEEVGSFSCVCPEDNTAAKCNGGPCIDLTEDEFNCGDCNKECIPNQTCVKSTCCDNPANDLCNGACTDTTSDAANCGMCDNACGTGGTCVMGTCCEEPNTACGTQCVNTQTSPSHCGACDNACAPGLSCISGKCCTGTDNAVCGGACTNLQTDNNNCGVCGKVCVDPMPTCSNGTCM